MDASSTFLHRHLTFYYNEIILILCGEVMLIHYCNNIIQNFIIKEKHF